MLPILLALGAGALVFAAGHGKSTSAPDPGATGTVKHGKSKAPARRMSPAEAFEAGKKAHAADLKVKADEDAAFDLKVQAAIKARDKAAPKPAAPIETPEPEVDP